MCQLCTEKWLLHTHVHLLAREEDMLRVAAALSSLTTWSIQWSTQSLLVAGQTPPLRVRGTWYSHTCSTQHREHRGQAYTYIYNRGATWGESTSPWWHGRGSLLLWDHRRIDPDEHVCTYVRSRINHLLLFDWFCYVYAHLDLFASTLPLHSGIPPYWGHLSFNK